jgi:trimeric autotransporter adhesin
MRTIALVLFTCVCFSWNGWSQPYTITTIAGTSRLLEGSTATSAPLREPISVAVDGSGNLYIADQADSRIRKVDPNGIISTYAGTGLPGFSGDRGPANAAQINGPAGIALDAKGNMYVADEGNAVIRRISADGTIDTIAGNGNPIAAGDNGPATSAQFDPVAIAVDAHGNYYIADGINYRIRKVDTNGIITTIAGIGRYGYSGDNGPATSAAIDFVTDLVVDSAGNIYLADYYNSAVRKIDTTGMITTIAGTDFGVYDDGVPATQAVMIPSAVALDGSGNLYISDVDLNHTVIRRVDLSTGLIYTVAGTGQVGFQGDGGVATAAELNDPNGLAFNSGVLYVADTGNARVRKVAGNTIATVAGTSIRDNGPATMAFLNFPEGLAIDSSGDLLVADTGNNAARRFRLGGNINTFGQLLGSPFGAAVDQSGNFYVTDEEPSFPSENPHVLKLEPDGTTSIIAGTGPDGYAGDGLQAAGAGINLPRGLAVDTTGNIYLADFGDNRVRIIDTQGVIQTIAGNGKPLFSGDGGPAIAAGINPVDVAVDSQGDVFVLDQANNRVRKIAPNGNISTVVGNGLPGYQGDGGPATAAELNLPTGIAIDQAGNLYIADEGNEVVRRVTTGGLISTIAGNGTMTPSSGDGGPATAAALDPWSIAVDAAGNVYVTDSFNDRVRELTPLVVKAASMSIVSGNSQAGVVGTALAAPLVLKVADSTGAGVPGVYVSFAISPAGAATLSPSPALTLNDGTVSLMVTLGSAPGPITITATSYAVPNLTFSITATVSDAPSILTGGITSAGLSNPPVDVLSPNAIVTIFGKNFAPTGTAIGAALVHGQLPTNLGGVCVEFGTVRAPIFTLFPTQLNVQVPAVAPGNVPVQVITGCDTPQAVATAPVSIAAQATAPEFFYFVTNASGVNPIAAVDSLTGAYIGPQGLFTGVTPAKAGEFVTLYATGFGATNPSFAPGVLPGGIASVTASATVQIGAVTLNPSDILYVGVTGFAGLYQLNLRVPSNVANGNQPLVITVGGVASSPNAFLAIQN